MPCIFGCRDFECCDPNASDNLTHYLECPIMWTLIRSAACNNSVQNLCVNSVYNIGFVDLSIYRLKLLAIAYRVYHAIKICHRSEVHNAHTDRNYDRVHQLCLDFSRLFSAELALTDASD